MSTYLHGLKLLMVKNLPLKYFLLRCCDFWETRDVFYFFNQFCNVRFKVCVKDSHNLFVRHKTQCPQIDIKLTHSKDNDRKLSPKRLLSEVLYSFWEISKTVSHIPKSFTMQQKVYNLVRFHWQARGLFKSTGHKYSFVKSPMVYWCVFCWMSWLQVRCGRCHGSGSVTVHRNGESHRQSCGSCGGRGRRR